VDDQIARIERSLDRLTAALDDADDEIAVLAATAVRAMLALAERGLSEDARLAALRDRAGGLLARAPLRLRGTTAILRLLAAARHDQSVAGSSGSGGSTVGGSG
jgi:hypothetical protein